MSFKGHKVASIVLGVPRCPCSGKGFLSSVALRMDAMPDTLNYIAVLLVFSAFI